MMHLDDGEIKSYLDLELPEAESTRIQEHLASCERCQALARELQARSGLVTSRLEALQPGGAENPAPASVARVRLQESYIDKEKIPMINKIFSKQYRFAWAALGVIAVLGIAMLFPSVRAAANSFLGLFRVQQITLVSVDSGDMPDRLAASRQLETLMSDEANFEEVGEYQVVDDASQASQVAGIPVRLPADLGEPAKIEIQQGGKMSMTVDLARIQAVLEEIGRSDIQLPPEIDGAEVSVNIPVAVQASFGDCLYEEREFDPDSEAPMPKDCTRLIQAASPEINAPPGLDIAKLGQAFLEVAGMSPEKAAEFSQSVDWSNTLVIPVPSNIGSYKEVTVDGVPGKLVWNRQQPDEPEYMLMWVKDGVVYGLAGRGEKEEALQIANSLQ
jgi:hypothetical protein